MNLIEEITERLDAITKAPRKYREFFAHMIMSVIAKENNITIIANQREIIYDNAWLKQLADMFAVMDFTDKDYCGKKFIEKIERKKYKLTNIPAEILDEVITYMKKGELPNGIH